MARQHTEVLLASTIALRFAQQHLISDCCTKTVHLWSQVAGIAHCIVVCVAAPHICLSYKDCASVESGGATETSWVGCCSGSACGCDNIAFLRCHRDICVACSQMQDGAATMAD